MYPQDLDIVIVMTVMKDEDIPSDCYIRHQAEGIDIICSNIGLAGTEVQLVNAMSREYVLKQILYGIKDQYDAVIIDCMPSLGMITINALAASDEVLIPVEASYLPIKGLQQLLKTIGKVRKQINPKLQVGGILFTMVDAHTNDARNDDMVLYLALCNACLKDAGAMPLAEIMTQHKYLGLPSFESVSRTRRKLQARYPELAGSRPVQKMRATGEKAYRRYAKE